MLYQVSKEEGSKPTSGYFREELQCYVHTLHSKSLTVTPSVWCKSTPFRKIFVGIFKQLNSTGSEEGQFYIIYRRLQKDFRNAVYVVGKMYAKVQRFAQ